jgi:arginyl-tRNA--protein-N-Asp/Glu arginylyltransferase
MKKLAVSPAHDFSLYIAREDTHWCEKDPTESLERIYDAGYLPYSGAKGTKDIFYSARSARVVLPQFELSSENRRIARKFDGIFTKERVKDFEPDEAFFAFCVAYFAKKHGAAAMPRERVETILRSGLVTEVVTYRKGQDPVAYVLEVTEGNMGHYWFSFYDLAYARQSLGLWLMLDCLRDAKAAGRAYYYLGTVYGQNALYKTNFSPLQWWSGESWSDDVRALKTIAKQD